MTLPASPTRWDVFLSHAHADLERHPIEALAQALRAEGLAVWIDAAEIADFDAITRRITEGVARSKALLAIYSTAFAESRPCQFELTAAVLAAQAEDPDGVPRRVLALNPEEGVRHVQPVALRDQHLAAAPAAGDGDAVRALARNVAGRVRALEGLLGDVAVLEKPPWHGTVGVGSERFVGRRGALWEIHARLAGSRHAVVTGQAGRADVAQVRGQGGMGKSLLAEEYGIRFAPSHPGGVFWLRAHGADVESGSLDAAGLEARRQEQVLAFASGLGLLVQDLSPEEVDGQLRVRLEKEGLPFLWVVDDLPHGLDEEARRRWMGPVPLARTLVTTRSRDRAEGRVDLEQLAPDEGYRLLTARRAPEGDAEEEAARAIVGELGGHPLAVDVAGGALAAQAGLSGFADFLADLTREEADALELVAELGEELPNGHEKSVATTLLRSLALLDPKGDGEGDGEHGREPGWDVLRLGSALAAAPVPARLLAAVLAQADGIDEPEARRHAARGLDRAAKLSLAGRAEDAGGAYTVHALVRRTVRFRDARQDRRAALRDAAVAVLGRDLAAVADPRTHAELALEVAHARELTAEPATEAELLLLGWVARHDHERGAYPAAEEGYRRQRNEAERLLGDEHPDTLASLSNLAETLHALGHLDRAREFQERALEGRRRVLGDKHPDTLMSMNNLARTLHAQGDLDGARALHEKALEVQRRVLGDEQFDTLMSMNNLAATLRAQGDLHGARALHEKALEGRRRLLGDEHPHTVSSMNNLADALQALGDLDGARTLHEKALEVCKRVLGDEHPHTLTSMNNLAGTLSDKGDLDGARALLQTVLEIRRRTFGDDHPDSLTSMNNLAGTLRAQGDLDGARVLQERALEGRGRLLGYDHHDTLTSLNNLAATLHAQGELDAARTLHEKALEVLRRVLGDEHPHSLGSMQNLAETLRAKGDLDGASALGWTALEVTRRVLGDEHPGTLTSMNNLAGTLRAQGDLDGARALHEKALEGRRRVLGDEHPDTLTSMNNLAVTLRDRGDLDGARALHEQELQACRRVLGDEHPGTLTSMNNLAATLRDKGDLEGARALEEKALDVRLRILGDRHSDTMISAWNLFTTLDKLGDRGAAQRVLDEHLAWLLAAPPETLGADARRVQAILRSVTGGGLPAGDALRLLRARPGDLPDDEAARRAALVEALVEGAPTEIREAFRADLERLGGDRTELDEETRARLEALEAALAEELDGRPEPATEPEEPGGG